MRGKMRSPLFQASVSGYTGGPFRNTSCMGGVVAVSLIGRWGNQLFMYAYARAYAEHVGAEFQCDPWMGSRIFELDDPPVASPDLPRRDENTLVEGETDTASPPTPSSRNASCTTRDQVKSWFVIRPELESVLRDGVERWSFVAHRRAGDYFGYGYPVVSEASYLDACHEFGLPVERLRFVTEETPLRLDAFESWAPFLPDFYRLLKADVLLRGNSSFSWWAGTLGDHARVFSPVIDGLAGGREHDCRFRPDNSARFCNLDFVTDLHV